MDEQPFVIPAGQSIVPAQAERQDSLALAIGGGVAAMIISAAVWGAITYVTDLQVGFMAIGVGLAVGLAVRVFGGGRSVAFGVVAAVLALVGVLLGNLTFFAGAIAREEGIGFFEVLGVLLANPGAIVELFGVTFEIIDALFYGLAVYVGFRTAYAR